VLRDNYQESEGSAVDDDGDGGLLRFFSGLFRSHGENNPRSHWHSHQLKVKMDLLVSMS
jgi:hypothetical protein